MELLLALGILAFSCLALFGAQNRNVDQAARASFQSQAALLASGKLAECRLQPFAGLTDSRGNFGPDFPDLLWELRVRELKPEETGLAGGKGLLKLVELRLKARHLPGQEYALRTLVAPSLTGKEATP